MKKSFYHICNLSTSESAGCKNIVSKKDLQEIKEDSNVVYLLHVHLNWEGNKLSNNYGFDVANLIRTEKKSKAPIIFYSSIQVEYFELKSEKEIKYKILFGRGSAFIEAPFKEAKLKELAATIEPLSNAALHDVATMLCDLKGIVIDKLNHDLKYGTDVSSVIASICPYLTSYQKQAIQLYEYAEKLQKRTKAKDSNGFFSDKQQFITLCNFQLTASGKPESETKKSKHSILLIDDLLTEIEKAKEYLKDDFKIETANTGKEAISILEKDIKNEIVAVVCDWRLFTDIKQNHWQPLQGYEILEYASKTGIRALFALTKQADFVVHHIRNLMGVRFAMFKKENLLSAEQWKVFADVLNESCEQAVQLRSALPDSAQWTKKLLKKGVPLKTLKQQYIEVWNSDERNSYFSKITTTANEIWDYLCDTPNNIALNSQFGITIPTKILILEPILIYRRIWLALWFDKIEIGKRISRETEYSEDIYKRMFAPGLNREKPESGSQNAYKLCIEINKVQQGKFLPEEKEWLISHNLL